MNNYNIKSVRRINMKKIFSIVISLCILCTSPIVVFAQENKNQANCNKVEIAYENNKALRAESYIDMIDEELIDRESAINETNSLISNLISYNQNLEEIYAGSYMSNDKLVVMLTGSQAYFTTVLSENNISTQNIVFELVDYSYSYLDDCIKNIDSLLDEKNPTIIDANISMYHIDEQTNAVFVYLRNYTTSTIDALKKLIINDDCIVFYESKNEVKKYAEGWRPGRDIHIYTVTGSNGTYTATPVGGYSTGYMASKGSSAGFVTAAHSNHVGDYVYISALTDGSQIFSSTYRLGIINSRQYNEYIDAAFVKITSSNYTQSNSIYWTSSQAGVTRPGTYMDAAVVDVSSITSSTTIYKSGSATYLTTGHLRNSSVTLRTEDGIILSGLIQTTVHAARGDSGAISYVISGANYRGKALGIVHGGDDNGYTYIVKATTINSRLGLTIN